MITSANPRRWCGLTLPDAAMIALALFAFAWAVARACVQAVTIDEAETYVFFVSRHDPFQWFPAANNHVLNSLLMRGFVSVFGVSHLSVRAPALIGAALYVAAGFWLSRLVASRWALRLALFVCLVYNPFVFDFLVAARGYGLAMAFLLWAIALPAWCFLNPERYSARRLTVACGVASACLALSFTACFTFAFVNTLALLALLIWVSKVAAPAGARLRLLVACILPGLAVLLLLPSYTLLHWPKGQLFFGGASLWESVASVIRASLYQLNPNLVNPLLLPWLVKVKRFLVPVICALVLFRACLTLRSRWTPLPALGGALAGIAVLTLLVHWICFHLFGLLLPGDRTAIYLVPLLTLAAGIAAAIPLPGRPAALGARFLTAMLVAMGGYYMLCMRLTYFREWQYVEEVKKVYHVVAWYNHHRGVREVESNWPYHNSLLFYRDLSGQESFSAITSNNPHPPGKQLYVLSSSDEENFIRQNQLRVVFRGNSTDVVVAVQPAVALPVADGNIR